MPQPGDKAARRAARERMAWYHDEHARLLVARPAEAAAAYQREEIDAFQMDDLVARYGRARRALDRGEVGDWWAAAGRRE